MGKVRVEDFTSDTNATNFIDDIQRALPSLHFEVDWNRQAVIFDLPDYEANREQITEFARYAGAAVFHAADVG